MSPEFREKAYQIVQENAMKVWAGENTFQELLEADPRIRKWLTPKELSQLFDLNHTLQNVELIFRRVFKKKLKNPCRNAPWI